MSRRAVPALVVLLAALVAGCRSVASQPGGRLRVVASTNVYGDIATSIGGDQVSVTSIINDPSQDPHSYQASARTQLALSKADVVIENGGGYDDFVHTMLGASNSTATVIDAVQVSGKTAMGGELNEHVWYDFASVRKVVAALVAHLSAKDEADASTFRRNAAAFLARLGSLQSAEASIKATHAGTGVAITEPLPLYLLEACGLVNRTPAAFSQAVEAGDDVSSKVLTATLDLLAHHDVALLAYAEQTAGPQTERMLAVAKRSDVPVVGVTETLPAGTHYLSWMAGNLAAIRSALV